MTERAPKSSGYTPFGTEEVIHAATHAYTPTKRPLSSIKGLIDLTGADTNRDINGRVPNAAGVSEQNAGNEALSAYQELYPRDAHQSAKILWRIYPGMTRSTIRASLVDMGTVDNLANTERIDQQDIGKIPHQVRSDDHPRSKRQFELRRRGYPFYGAVDTTGKNVLAIARVSLEEDLAFLQETYTSRSGEVHTIGEGLDANVDWLMRHTAKNPEGLNESIQINPRHHANESWADSPDSFHHKDGTYARHHPEKGYGVASVEVNAETYDALRAAVRVYEAQLNSLNDEERERLESRIAEIEERAAILRQSIIDKFWVEDENYYGGYFACGTDRDEEGTLHPLEIRSSDMGHVLDSEVLEDGDPKVVSLILNLFSEEMLSPNGIRTLSNDSARYDDHAYHNGSVWPWDTYKIALGLRKHDYHGLAHELEKRILKFSSETNTFAEYGSGGDDIINMTEEVTVFDPALHKERIDQFSEHKAVQPPQEYQAWTIAAVRAIKEQNGNRIFGRPADPIEATDPTKRQFELLILENLPA